MDKIKKGIVTICISYTVVSCIIYLIQYILGIRSINFLEIIQILSCIIFIYIALSFSANKLSSNIIVSIVVDIFNLLLIVFIFSHYFDWFNGKASNLLVNIGIALSGYIIISLIINAQVKKDVNEINIMLKNKKDRGINNQHDKSREFKG